MCLHPKNRPVSIQKRRKMFCFHHCRVFTRCCFKFMPVRAPFSKSTVFEICRQKMCRFRVNRRPIRRIFHRFQNVPASCERSLNHLPKSSIFLEVLRAEHYQVCYRVEPTTKKAVAFLYSASGIFGYYKMLKGHSVKIRCFQRLISLSRSKCRLYQPSEIVFLSSIALLKRKIWRKTFGPISFLIPYYFMLRFWRKKVANFRYCPPVGRRRVLMGLLRVTLRIEYEHAVVLVHSCVHDRLRPREMIGFTDNSRFLSRIQIQGYG